MARPKKTEDISEVHARVVKLQEKLAKEKQKEKAIRDAADLKLAKIVRKTFKSSLPEHESEWDSFFANLAKNMNSSYAVNEQTAVPEHRTAPVQNIVQEGNNRPL